MFIAPMKALVFIFAVIVNCLAIRFMVNIFMESNRMTPEGKQKLRAMLVEHEKYVQFPYSDITGHLTIGIGRNLTDRGISNIEAFYLLDDDIAYFSGKLLQYLKCYSHLNEARQIAVVDMCFNLGIQGFLNFRETISALEVHDYDRAADEILNSKAAQQAPSRYADIANIVRTGEI
jgi:lysozyme